MYKVYSIGEFLIDMLNEKNSNYKAQAGGAPANVSFVVKRLGGETELITSLGNDNFGKYLYNLLVNEEIPVNQISFVDKKTMLAFVDLDDSGERTFSFYDENTADKHLTYKEDEFKNTIIHYCSVSLQNENNINVHKEIINKAKDSNSIISFDPNLRFSLWKNLSELKNVVNDFLTLSDLVKVSDEELLWISEEDSEEKAAKYFLEKGVKVLLVTKGELGTTIYKNDFKSDVAGFKVNVVDTTGAGDAFIGAFLYKLQEKGLPLEELSNIDLIEFVSFANKIASISITRNGAIDSYIF